MRAGYGATSPVTLAKPTARYGAKATRSSIRTVIGNRFFGGNEDADHDFMLQPQQFLPIALPRGGSGSVARHGAGVQ